MTLGAREISSHPIRTAVALILLASITVLLGCQGLSSGNSGQQKNSDLLFAVQSLNFGSVVAGSSKTLAFSATNSGSKAVTVNSVAMSSKYFSLASPSFPVVLAAGQSTSLGIRFTPNSAGAFSGTVSVSSDASNSVPNVAVSGMGLSDGQLALDPTSEDFGSVTVGSKKAQTVTLTNTGQTSVNISQASISGAGFQLSGISTPLTLDASQSTTLTVAFAPQATGSADGSLTITSDAANPTLTMALSALAIPVGALGSNPTSLSFGSVTAGNNKSLSESVTNTGSSSISISNVAISGAGFGVSGIAAPMTLGAGQSANFSVSFTPQSVGSASGSLALTSSASNPKLTIALSGTGTAAAGQLTVSPSTLGVGSVVVGASGSATGSLTASGASVTVTAASTNNSVFSIGGLPLPLTIPAGQSASFKITFSPKTSGAVSSALTITSNAQATTTTETLTGTGTAAPNHSVNLSWNPSTSSNVSGYNVYRAPYVTSCQSYEKINSLLNSGTLYTDSAVVDGASYCYETTAVNTSNEESAPSNTVSNVQIPSP